MSHSFGWEDSLSAEDVRKSVVAEQARSLGEFIQAVQDGRVSPQGLRDIWAENKVTPQSLGPVYYKIGENGKLKSQFKSLVLGVLVQNGHEVVLKAGIGEGERVKQVPSETFGVAYR